MNLKEQIKADIDNHEVMACHNLDNALQAVEFSALMGSDNKDSAGYNVSNGVATINVRGLLVPSMFADFSDFGITGYNHITEYLERAESDPTVNKIVLDIDSGGGYVRGIDEPTQAIKDATKPVETFVSGSMYSAAYWLGATADTITASQSAGVGSIGVYNVHKEQSKAFADEGVKFSLFRSGKWKAAFNNFMPLSDEEKQALQASVDESASVFFNHVAAQRNITAKTVADWEGGTFDAKQALDNKLIDNISDNSLYQTSEEDSMTLEQALAENENLKAQVSAKDAELQELKAAKRTSEIESLAEKSGREFTEAEMADMKAMDDTAFKMMASFIPEKAQNNIPDGIFEEQATNGRNVNQNDNLDDAIAKWAGV